MTTVSAELHCRFIKYRELYAPQRILVIMFRPEVLHSIETERAKDSPSTCDLGPNCEQGSQELVHASAISRVKP